MLDVNTRFYFSDKDKAAFALLKERLPSAQYTQFQKTIHFRY